MYTITLPQAVKDMHSATVARWFKGPGDPVQKGEALVEMDTERARVEARADRDGYVRELLVPEGKTVVGGEPIARISASGEAAADYVDIMGHRARPNACQWLPARPSVAECRAAPFPNIAHGYSPA